MKELSLIYDCLQQRLRIARGIRAPPSPFFHAAFEDLPWRFRDFLELKQPHAEALLAFSEEGREAAAPPEESSAEPVLAAEGKRGKRATVGPEVLAPKLEQALVAYGKPSSLERAVLETVAEQKSPKGQ